MTIITTSKPHRSAVARLAAASFCLAMVATLGCQDGRSRTFPVTGAVSFSDGAPVRSGYVQLIPVDGGPSPRGEIDQNGQFTIGTYENADGAAAGEYDVLVVQHARPITPQQARELGPEHAQHAGSAKSVSLKYASSETSDLKCTVSESEENRLTLVVDAQKSLPIPPPNPSPDDTDS